MNSNSKIAATLASAALLVVLGATVLFSTFQNIEDAANARKHVFVLMNEAGTLLSELRDAETGQRGFLLSGDEAFLAPYLATFDKVEVHLSTLRRRTLLPDAGRHLKAMADLVPRKLAEMKALITLRRTQDMAGVVARVTGGEGKRLMDAIRVEMAQFDQIERAALSKIDADFQARLRQLLTVLIGATLAALVAALLFAYLIYRESQHRLRAAVHVQTMQLLNVQERANLQLEDANNTLRLSEAKLAVTLNSIGDAVLATDEQGRVTLLNPVAEQLTGWIAAEAAGRPVEEIFHIVNQETRAPANIPVQAALEHGAIQGLANHTVLIGRTGRECAIADSCAPIRGIDDKVVGAVLVFRDVTEEYAVQQALRDKNVQLQDAMAVAEQANLAKSDFLSSMSHELRTPLNAILGFAQLLETDVPPPSTGQQQSIAQILQAGWHLLQLINEILDLAKVESGKISLSREPLPLAEVLAESLGMLQSQAQRRGITLLLPSDNEALSIDGDRVRVKQVLINLLSNAIKYNVENGTVEVLCSAGVPGRVRVSIRDTGNGLRPDQLTQLFEPFNRLGREAGDEEGSGIGLVVAKRLVELMGGTIGVESTVGVGSTFWIELLAV